VFWCAQKCDKCVTENGCWVDTTYGSESDVKCFHECYDATECAEAFGSESDLCDCDGHGKCVMGCPGKCDDSLGKTCNVDCLTTSYSEEECHEFCDR
jgi:hypothetical protein